MASIDRNPPEENSRIKQKGAKILTLPFGSPVAFGEAIKSLHQSKQPIDNEVLDKLLGMEYDKSEDAITSSEYEPRTIWRKGPKQRTQTSYEIIRKIYQNIAICPGQLVFDLGSGYGRVLLYGASLLPEVSFKGVEIVVERAQEVTRIARNAGLINIEVVNDHVLNVDLSDGAVFYMFN